MIDFVKYLKTPDEHGHFRKMFEMHVLAARSWKISVMAVTEVGGYDKLPVKSVTGLRGYPSEYWWMHG